MPPAAGGLSPPDPRHGMVGRAEAWSAGGGPSEDGGWNFGLSGRAEAAQPDNPKFQPPTRHAKTGDFGAIKASRQNHPFSHGWSGIDGMGLNVVVIIVV